MIESTIIILNGILAIYNSCFWLLLLITIGILVTKFFNLRNKSQINDNYEYFNFESALVRELLQIIVEIAIIVVLFLMIDSVVKIDMYKLLNTKVFLRVYIGLYALYHLSSGRKRIKELSEIQFKNDIMINETTLVIKNMFQGNISFCKIRYELELEKLNLLKSMIPISLIPTVAGYIFRNNIEMIRLNVFTIIFFTAIAFFFIQLIMTYRNYKYWKLEKHMIEVQYREYLQKENKK